MKAYHLTGKAPYYTNCYMLTDNKGCAVLIDCSADVEKVKSIISDVIEKNPMALKNPEPFVRLSEQGKSALIFTVRIWCKNADYWDVNYDTIENVKRAFDENRISIPYNQLDVHIDNK